MLVLFDWDVETTAGLRRVAVNRSQLGPDDGEDVSDLRVSRDSAVDVRWVRRPWVRHDCHTASSRDRPFRQPGSSRRWTTMVVVDGTKSGLDEVRTRIVAERRRLQSLVDSLTANFDDLTEAADASPPDDEHDPEGHTIAFERSQLTGRRDGCLRAIAELAAAEIRLGDAQSGLCEGCGDPIPHERRLAVPTTTRCVECARPGPPRHLGTT